MDSKVIKRNSNLGISFLTSSLPIILAVFYFIYPSYFVLATDRWVLHDTGKIIKETDNSGHLLAKGNKQGIPVLVYHFISENPGLFNLDKRTFIEHLKMLKSLGYNTVSIEDIDKYLNNNGKLPENPILITFDDGARNAYTGADEALRLLGMKATMFVIASRAEKGSVFYLNWQELRAMKRSGRWDIQSHSYDGHGNIVIDKDGHKAPFFGSTQYLMDKKRKETIGEYKARVMSDIKRSITEIEANIPGEHVVSFAYPFSDYGQKNKGNLVKNALAECIKKQSLVAFRQSVYFLNDRDTERIHLRRLLIHRSTSAEDLREELQRLYLQPNH